MVQTGRRKGWILTLVGAWCLVNALIIGGFGIATVFGNRLVFEPGGIGPDRIAIASIFGPLAAYAGWILIGISGLAAAEAIGILGRHNWSRLALLAVAFLACVSTSITITWSLWQGEWGTVFWGAIKVALYGTVIALLQSGTARDIFSR